MASTSSWALAWQDAAEKAKQMAAAMQESTKVDWEAAAAKARAVASQLQENGSMVASQTTKITQQLSETTKVLRACVRYELHMCRVWVTLALGEVLHIDQACRPSHSKSCRI